MAYIGKSPTGTGVRQRYYFTATGGETTLGASVDDNGLTLSYSDGAYVDVLLNGIELVAGTDYNTNTANRISGLAALAASDVVTVTVYDIFTVADTVSAKDGGTFSGNVNLNGTTTTSGTLDVNSTLDISSSNFKMTDLTSNSFYRQGDWTPVWTSSGATDKTASITTGTYAAQVGRYVRIGDLIFFTAFINSPSTWTFTNNGASGDHLYLAGLPFKGLIYLTVRKNSGVLMCLGLIIGIGQHHILLTV